MCISNSNTNQVVFQHRWKDKPLNYTRQTPPTHHHHHHLTVNLGGYTDVEYNIAREKLLFKKCDDVIVLQIKRSTSLYIILFKDLSHYMQVMESN